MAAVVFPATRHYVSQEDGESRRHHLHESVVQRAFKEVRRTSLEKDVDLRTAALMLGIGRIAEAKRRRGVFP